MSRPDLIDEMRAELREAEIVRAMGWQGQPRTQQAQRIRHTGLQQGGTSQEPGEAQMSAGDGATGTPNPNKDKEFPERAEADFTLAPPPKETRITDWAAI